MLRHSLLVIGLFLGFSTLSQEKSQQHKVLKNGCLIRVGGLAFLVEHKEQLFKKDTIDVLDFGEIARNCIPNINGDFYDSAYNSFTVFNGRESYYDKSNIDSILAWLDVKIFLLNVCVKYDNYRMAPVESRYYYKIEQDNKIFVFKCFTYIDIKKICIQKNNENCVEFVECYWPIHSVLEKKGKKQ